MPANLKELRGKIRNVKSTQQITKAMKLVSAAKFGRAQHAVTQSRPYYQGMAGVVQRLSGQSGISTHQMVSENGSKKVILFVVSSQRGLCGGYNSNIAKEALAQVKSIVAAGLSPTIICLGRKAYQLLGPRVAAQGFEYSARKQIDEEQFGSVVDSDAETSAEFFKEFESTLSVLNLPFDKPSIELGRQLGGFFRSLFLSGVAGEIRIVFSKFGSAISQTPTALTVLPMRAATSATAKQNVQNTATESTSPDYLFEPSLDALVSAALPRFLDIQVLQVLKEALASEHGARMTAMDNATRNAKDMERRYQVRYQRARQAAITTELVEIISGAEAL
jgi:F-type H+-transporting ATPase subunit gamma